MSDTFMIEVDVTSEYYEVVEFTFSQKTLDELNCKDKDELLWRIKLQDIDPFDYAEQEHWDAHDSAIKEIHWKIAKHVN